MQQKKRFVESESENEINSEEQQITELQEDKKDRVLNLQMDLLPSQVFKFNMEIQSASFPGSQSVSIQYFICHDQYWQQEDGQLEGHTFIA
jgi:hypothetical protein